ncbi:MAG: hypothetical protein LW832_07920 [Parachlamydia sp.]|jgi:hypothetical protein|nr:hypothetical protein [Parachlamydia sp.]
MNTIQQHPYSGLIVSTLVTSKLLTGSRWYAHQHSRLHFIGNNILAEVKLGLALRSSLVGRAVLIECLGSVSKRSWAVYPFLIGMLVCQIERDR